MSSSGTGQLWAQIDGLERLAAVDSSQILLLGLVDDGGDSGDDPTVEGKVSGWVEQNKNRLTIKAVTAKVMSSELQKSACHCVERAKL